MPDLAKTEISNLEKRYLIWLYKITKESLDRIDRKFTQLDIDNEILKGLERVEVANDKAGWHKLLDEFKDYISKKEKDAKALKYSSPKEDIKVGYLFLKNKLRMIEQIISKQFGNRELKRIQCLYEEEMVERILAEREHK